jgi:hypothetical protein
MWRAGLKGLRLTVTFLRNWLLVLGERLHPGRSESRVARSEVAIPCGFSLPPGRILPSCVRVKSAVEEMVDGVAEGEYNQN